MDDMTASIEPKSDQMNAEDLLSGPRTFTIARVRVTETADQPVWVYLDGFPADRPFKPSKTVRRLMVVAWGPDSAAYVGKRLTLYRDPEVKWGGMDVGGIRVSHMSGLTGPLNVALTVTRGRRAPYTVDPLRDVPTGRAPNPGPSLADRVARMIDGFGALGVSEDDLAWRIGRPRAGWAEDDLNRMTEVYSALRDGRMTRAEAFPRTDVAGDDLPPDPGPPPARPVQDVQLPPDPDDDRPLPTTASTAAMFAELGRVPELVGDRRRDDRIAVMSAIADRPIASSMDLTPEERLLVKDTATALAADLNDERRQETITGYVADGERINAAAQQAAAEEPSP